MPRSKSQITVVNVSVVFVGAAFNPQTFDGDRLIENGIVPTGWKVTGGISTPVVTQTPFQNNKYAFKAGRNMITFLGSVVDGGGISKWVERELNVPGRWRTSSSSFASHSGFLRMA